MNIKKVPKKLYFLIDQILTKYCNLSVKYRLDPVKCIIYSADPPL